MVQLKDPASTGNFEITVNGALVHSKKTREDGFFEVASTQKQEEVKAAIEEAVKGLQEKHPFSAKVAWSTKSTGDFEEGLVS